MKISYDSEVDALSITFRETTVTTKHWGEGIAADYDADGKLVGIEISVRSSASAAKTLCARLSLKDSAPPSPLR
jgi:uncharacterized protein YuzE